MIDRFLICVSYGNDSIAMLQYMHEIGANNCDVLYNDTGWAADEWSARVQAMEIWAETKLGFVCHRTSSIGMEALVKAHKGWPRQGMQFCTQELKIEPMLNWLSEADPGNELICCVGVKRSDGKNRLHVPEIIENSPAHGGRMLWHPLCFHSVAERDALIIRAGFEVLPHRSKECGICINEKREGLKNAAPTFVEKIERIEGELGYTSNGKPRTMFRPYRAMGATGIREIIRWANSAHGNSASGGFDPDDGTGYDCDGGMCGT